MIEGPKWQIVSRAPRPMLTDLAIVPDAHIVLDPEKLSNGEAEVIMRAVYRGAVKVCVNRIKPASGAKGCVNDQQESSNAG